MEDLTILWLDDQREPYNYFKKRMPKFEKGKLTGGAELRNLTFYNNNIFNKYNVKFDWVKNLEEFASYIEQNGLPQFVSFDRDLTPKGWMKTHDGPLADGIECAKWLRQYCEKTGQKMPQCFAHTANPRALPELEAVLGDAALRQEMNEQRKLKKAIKNIVKNVLAEMITR